MNSFLSVQMSFCDRIRKRSRFLLCLGPHIQIVRKTIGTSFFIRFDREGYELEFEIEEKGYAQFICKIHLPVDAPPGFNTLAQATVKGIYYFLLKTL